MHAFISLDTGCETAILGLVENGLILVCSKSSYFITALFFVHSQGGVSSPVLWPFNMKLLTCMHSRMVNFFCLLLQQMSSFSF